MAVTLDRPRDQLLVVRANRIVALPVLDLLARLPSEHAVATPWPPACARPPCQDQHAQGFDHQYGKTTGILVQRLGAGRLAATVLRSSCHFSSKGCCPPVSSACRKSSASGPPTARQTTASTFFFAAASKSHKTLAAASSRAASLSVLRLHAGLPHRQHRASRWRRRAVISTTPRPTVGVWPADRRADRPPRQRYRPHAPAPSRRRGWENSLSRWPNRGSSIGIHAR